MGSGVEKWSFAMTLRNAFLSTALLFTVNSMVPSEQVQKPSWGERIYQWITNLFSRTTTTDQKSTFSTATQKTTNLDLAQFYQGKESDQKSMIDPVKSADKFRLAIENAAQKASSTKPPGIMARFKDHPEKFLFGASSSSYQYEGGLDEHNANAQFYKDKGLLTAKNAIEFWTRYETDIKQMKEELGINSFRLSIAWERVQPQQGEWNQNAINTYIDIIATLKKYNIEPIVVLHHYTIPQWFAEIDGFEKVENNSYFVEFAKTMYIALRRHVTYWSTFNAIEGYAFKGYHTLDGPPGIKSKKSLQQTQVVMANMLNAHVQVYQAIKGPGGLYTKGSFLSDPQIGIQKNIILLDPNRNSWICTQKATTPICVLGTTLQDQIFFDLFTTDKFKLRIPTFTNIPALVDITGKDENARKSIDWIGVNIYSNIQMRLYKKLQETNEDRKTENLNYRDYPEGIYRAVKIINDKIAKPLNIPIIITENGIATTNDAPGNEKRTRFFRRALYTIRKLIEEGYPIIGYTPWASHDNYEWPSQDQRNPHDRPYGMFHVDFQNPELPRTLKTGSHYYRDFIKQYLDPKITIPTNTLIE